MGNTRRFNPSRRQRVLGLKESNKLLRAQLAMAESMIERQDALLQASVMQRPPDLEEWISSILPDMDEAERAEWDAMGEDEQTEFIDALGAKINQSITAAGS